MWLFEQIVEFFSFQDVNIRYVALGTLLLGASSAVVGCFTFLRKKSIGWRYNCPLDPSRYLFKFYCFQNQRSVNVVAWCNAFWLDVSLCR